MLEELLKVWLCAIGLEKPTLEVLFESFKLSFVLFPVEFKIDDEKELCPLEEFILVLLKVS